MSGGARGWVIEQSMRVPIAIEGKEEREEEEVSQVDKGPNMYD